MTEHGFDTRAIHAGQEPDQLTGAVTVPIYQTSTYKQDGVGEMRGGHDYARTVNPTRTALQEALASLEGGAHGIAFSSGMSAVDGVLRVICRPGDHMILPGDAYGGTYRLVARHLAEWGLEFTSVPLHDLNAVRAAMRPQTKVIWCESPTNPLLGIADIAALAGIAASEGARLVVDNTFASPYLQQPLAFGADVVVHSTTKYLGGHSDVVGGAAITSDSELANQLTVHQNSIGAVPGPFDAWLVLRGIKTLGVRMDRHCANADEVAQMLVAHPAVTQVFYPGLPDHPGHELAAKQMRDFGGMVSFTVRGGRQQAAEVCRRVQLFTLGESLGGVESLIEIPAQMTHASVVGSPLEVRDDLIRLSVGIEDVADLIADLLQALR
jgi:cystathionine gamma-synthase